MYKLKCQDWESTECRFHVHIYYICMYMYMYMYNAITTHCANIKFSVLCLMQTSQYILRLFALRYSALTVYSNKLLLKGKTYHALTHVRIVRNEKAAVSCMLQSANTRVHLTSLS